MRLTTYSKAQLANALLNNDVGDLPIASVFIKLHLGDPGAAATSNPAAETDRIAASFGANSSGVTSNDAAITWPAVLDTETVTHWSAWSASSGGNALLTGTLNGGTGYPLNAGNDFVIGIGELDVTFA